MATVTMTRQDYEALLEFSSKSEDDAQAVSTIQARVDTDNEIIRYKLYVQWNETAAPVPVMTGEAFPPLKTFVLELDRPITRVDVDGVLSDQGTKPVTVLVSLDLNGRVGLTDLDSWDFQLNGPK